MVELESSTKYINSWTGTIRRELQVTSMEKSINLDGSGGEKRTEGEVDQRHADGRCQSTKDKGSTMLKLLGAGASEI